MWVCGLSIEGSIWLLLAVAVADAILGTTLGLLASAFAQTEFQVVQFMPILVFPQILLGGIFLPRDAMPHVLEAISDWLPLSHAIDALNAVAGDTEDAAYVGGAAAHHRGIRRRLHRARLGHPSTPDAVKSPSGTPLSNAPGGQECARRRSADVLSGAPGGVRTHTGTILSRLPLPVGLRGRATSLLCRGSPNDQALTLGRAANSAKIARGSSAASKDTTSRRNRKLSAQFANTRIFRSHIGMARPW